MEGISSYLSFAVSLSSALATFYFWVVKARMERPRLTCYAAEPHLGGHAVSSCSDPVTLAFEPKVIIANYSTLPNAVLGATVWVRHRDNGWLPTRAMIEGATALPLNLAPMQTTRLNLRVTIELPAIPQGEKCRNTNETFALYRATMLPDQLEVRVELTGLCSRVFASTLQYLPRESNDTPATLRLVA
jgi:hypothetical protein